MIFVSSNGFSHDSQLEDAVDYLRDTDQEGLYLEFIAAFPKWPSLSWSDSWVDTEASGVDVEYTSWATDWIEANTPIAWWEGEPVIFEEDDDVED